MPPLFHTPGSSVFLRVFAFGAVSLAAPATLGILGVGCGTDEATTSVGEMDARPFRRDATTVDGFPENETPDAGSADQPSCAKYCDIVMANCADTYAQYASHAECMAFCGHFPPGIPGDRAGSTLACRLYWAGNPARTDPGRSCPPAGPFGGGVCGDRCEAFCTTTLSACASDAGDNVYPSKPDCASACLKYTYAEDAGIGEGPYGPAKGDTLNCRLFHLRHAVTDPSGGCRKLEPDSGTCKNGY